MPASTTLTATSTPPAARDPAIGVSPARSSGSAAAKPTPNHHVGDNCSHEITANEPDAGEAAERD